MTSTLSLVKHFGKTLAMHWGLFNAGNPQTGERQWRPMVNQDTNRLVTAYTHQQLMSFGRSLFCNLAPVRGAIIEKANYSVGRGWTPQSQAQDRNWADTAETWLWEHLKVCDIRGFPYDFHTGLFLASIALDRDGDVGALLTETPDGYPMLQFIPAHRIGSRKDGLIEEGQYKGYTMTNGTVFSAVGRAVAFNILGNKPETDRLVSERDFVLLYAPDWCDQGRGLPSISSAILDLQDFQDAQEGLRRQVLIDSTLGLQVFNDSGNADTGRSYIQGSQTATQNAGATGEDVQIERLEQGSIWYFKANSGQKVEPVGSERPHPNVGEFMESLLRGAYQGLEWPYEFCRDGGSSSREVIRLCTQKVQRTVEKRQALLQRLATRYVGYSISKAIKLKLIPQSPDWWKWNWQMPPKASLDFREARENREDLKMGMRSLQEDAGERSVDWQELIDQLAREARYKLEAAKREGVPVSMIELRTPNANAAHENQPQQEQPQ